MLINFEAHGTRRCSGCTLCCKLLPTLEINKPAGVCCPHQSHAKGCRIYRNRPRSCAFWSCRWLTDADTANLRRPDRVHYVIDQMPDYVTLHYDGEEPRKIPVLQIWVDPDYPDAHRDPELRAYLARMGERDGMAALVRFNNREGAITIFPPALTGGEWVEKVGGTMAPEHTLMEKLEAFSEA